MVIKYQTFWRIKMKVIDVNGWRENPDLSQAPDEIKGIIIKISEGCTIDEDFDRHLENAIAQRVPIGVYCYTHARDASRASTEAATLINKLNEYGDLDLSLGIWFDIEDGNVPSDKSPFEVAEIIMGFVNTITDYSHDIPVGIYSGYCCLTDQIDVDALPDYVRIWVANYSSRNYWDEEHPDRQCTMWQYSESYPIGNDYYDVEEWYDE